MKGDEFASWLAEHEGAFYAQVRRYFSDWDDVQDAAQQAMIRAWQWAQREDFQFPKTVVVLSCRFVCLQILKRRHERGEISYDRDPDLAQWLLGQRLATCPVAQEDLTTIPWFQTLTLPDQVLARLLYQGRSQREIASLVHTTRGAIFQDIVRLRTILAPLLVP